MNSTLRTFIDPPKDRNIPGGNGSWTWSGEQERDYQNATIRATVSMQEKCNPFVEPQKTGDMLADYHASKEAAEQRARDAWNGGHVKRDAAPWKGDEAAFIKWWSNELLTRKV